MKTALEWTYSNMITRCCNILSTTYPGWGGIGVKVCEEWANDCDSFYSWANLNGFKPGLHLHRKNSIKLYSPETCEFLTKNEHRLAHMGPRIGQIPKTTFAAHRIRLGLTVAQLAKIMSVSQGYVSCICAGSFPVSKKIQAKMQSLLLIHKLGLLPRLIKETKK